jgi:hypothetical protein
MLDFIGLIITTALMVLVVNTLTIFIDASRAAKVTLAAIIGVWIGLAAAVAEAGWLSIARPIPVVGLFVAVPLLAAALAATWPAAREALLGIPMPVMVALNVVRVFAVLFLMLAAQGRHRPVPAQRRLGRHYYGHRRGASALAPEGRRRATHHGNRGLESIRRCRSRAGDCLRYHVGGGLAFADFPGSWLGSDAARAMVVRPDGPGPDLAHPARDHRRAASACENGPSRDRDRVI